MWKRAFEKFEVIGCVSLTIGKPAFCLAVYLTRIHFRDELKHVGDVSDQKVKCRPIRTQEIGGVRLSETVWDMVCLSRPYLLKFFKACLPQNLLSPFLYALSHLFGKFFWFREHSAVKMQVFIITNSKVMKQYLGYFLVSWLFSQIGNVIFCLLLKTDVLKLKRLQFDTVLMTYLTSLTWHIPTIL